jgi:hypothetical protein
MRGSNCILKIDGYSMDCLSGQFKKSTRRMDVVFVVYVVCGRRMILQRCL